MSRHITRTFSIGLITITLATAPALAGTCPADLDGDGGVGFSDLTGMLAAWGPCGVPCDEDLDSSGEVGFADLTDLLAAWGPCPIDVFEYPVYENMLAVEIGQQYLGTIDAVALPPETYDRIDRDLALIRAEQPEIDGAPHQGPWLPFEMLLVIDQTLPQDDLEATIAFYQGELLESYFGGDIRLYDFPLGANPIALIPVLEAIPAVESAEENGWFGGGPLTVRWEPTDIGGGALLWTVVVGWEADGSFCSAGSCCECYTTYEFVIEENGALAPLGATSEPSPFCGGGDCTGLIP